MEIILNHDYFEDIIINDKYINNYDDSINSAVTFPTYDNYIISLKNQKIHIFIHLASSTISVFSRNIFDLKTMSILDLDYSEENHERHN